MSYQYQSAPQPVMAATALSRTAYRDQAAPPKPINIHADRRVVRGNTYAAAITTLNQLQAQAAAQAATRAYNQSFRRTGVAGQRSLHSRGKESGFIEPSASLSAMGKAQANAAAQTDDYLEELVGQVQERDVGLQTDEVESDKPVPVMFVPQRRGVDQATTIEQGELFSFDLAATPLVEALLGKALFQGLAEVAEEEEVKNLDARVRRHEEVRDLMIAESQRLAQANLRRHEEKERRLEQARAATAAEAELKAKLAARTTAKTYLAGLKDSVLSKLEAAGALVDPTARDVQHVFLPWLQAAVEARLETVRGARQATDELVMTAIRSIFDERTRAAEAEEMARRAEARRVREEEETRLRALHEAEEAATEAARVIAEAEQLEQEELERFARENGDADSLAGGEGDGEGDAGADGEGEGDEAGVIDGEEQE
jgi:hypothetical protein